MRYNGLQPHALLGLLCLIPCLAAAGCSSLGMSLYPSNSTLTREAKEVLDASRIPASMPRENAKTVLPPHALEPGDSLLIEPVNLERDLRLPADQIVLADGTVDLGPYGRVVVAGQNLEQAEALIEQQIAYQIRQQRESCQKFFPKQDRQDIDLPELPEDCDSIAVNVRMLEPVHRFYVLGEVNAPGAYPLSGFETVLDAIVTAGGLTTSANPCKILLARPTEPCDCRVTLPVCYREIVQMGNTSSNYQLQPGDRVFVSSRSCLDELMFWRADRPCSRCSGCNRPCRNPAIVTARPMLSVADPMIAPGSMGWLRYASDPLKANDLVEEGTVGNDAVNEPGLGDYLNSGNGPSTLGVEPNPDTDADGELRFE
ncbi:Polysaccharide biosynthesis/export protein [Neorhodopirellula pilleata]|uniref:Polysaccharide biosynthesis/export protein n=2 Tax=Neorhodopirellula pilleata TaxID=2714738 RepID=A0A5C6AX74_9BACT|nr:Polysaccharide biosynthesis/export protein [Neorhodopirellula pilleata]